MSTEFVGIELQLMGAEGVRRDLENLDRLLNSFRGRKKFDAGFTEARQQVIAYKGELEKLKREYSSIISDNKKVISNSKDSAKALTDSYKKGLISLKEYREEFHRLASQSREAASSNKEMNAEIDATRQKMWNAQQAVREFGQASREAGRTFKETFNMISSRVAHIGSAMQSFGNAMTQLTSPFRRLTSGILMGAGFKVFDKFSEGLNSAFTRSDILRKYSRNLQINFNKTADEAIALREALNDAVEGLPTGLDEIVNMANQFTASMGDADRAAKLAIATNNAFLASQSGETARYQGMLQLRDVIGGKKMNAREWQSLAQSMLPAIRMIGEEMGLTGQELNDYVASVQQGKVANKEFLDQLIKYGTSGKIVETARLAMDTWEAFFARVGTAASRLGLGIITTLDQLVETTTSGKFTSLNSFLDSKVIPAINRTSEAIQGWIKAHPDEIVNFFKNLSKIKVGNFLRGYAKGLEVMIGLVEKLGTALGKHPKLMSFLGGFFGVGGMLGRMSTIFGGLLKGTRHIWGGIGAGGSWLLKGKLGGIFGRIASIFGKKKDIQAAGETAKTIPSVADTFKGAFSALQGVMVAAGAVTLVSGAGFVAFKSVKSILSDLKDIGGILQDMTWLDAVHGANIVMSIGVFTKIFSALGEALGPQGLLGVAIASAASFLVAGSFAADMWAIKQGLTNIRDSILMIDEVASSITNLKGFGSVTQTAKDNLRNAVESIAEVAEVLQGKNGSPKDRGQVSKGIPKIDKTNVDSMKNLAGVFEAMKQAVTAINGMVGVRVTEGMSTIIEDLIGKMDDIYASLSRLSYYSRASELAENASNMASALDTIKEVVKKVNALAGASVKSDLSNLKTAFETVIPQMNEIAGQMATIAASFNTAFVESLDFSAINAAITEGLGSVLNTIASYESSFKSKANALADSFIKTLKSKMRYINVSSTINVSTSLGWVSGIAAAAQKLKDIAAQALSSVTVNTKVNAGGHVVKANGGMIYRSHGGGVPFRRRGTDTVPAMLTPGEYVHNKRAVSAFGIDFMRKVNNLDMKGAMNELMHRAGHMANINRGATITNNNYNNQRVVINNSNAGAGYTFRTASRFVGAF